MSEISNMVRNAGVVGAGGAGFPTHVKLEAKAEIFIVNGAECEPLLKTDQQLAEIYYDLLLKGLAYAMKATGAKEGIIAFKAKYVEAIAALKPLLTPDIRIEILPDIYPAGDEAITVWLITGRRLPPGGLPIHIGVVVNNVQTVINIARAIEKQPVINRTLTVTGAVRSPKTVTVALGTSLNRVLELAGGGLGDKIGYIEGGPIMGRYISDLNVPVTKTTGGLIALPEEHPLIRNRQINMKGIMRTSKAVCEQCRFCTDLCPRHIIGHDLSPHLIIRSLNYNRVGNPQLITSALICSECGVCEVYACPVGISPKRINIALKTELREKGLKYQGELGKLDAMAEYRLVPTNRLISRTGLDKWYREAPISPDSYEPPEVTLLLRQHIGAAAVPVVKKGESVTQGQLIGEIPENGLGARLHASISGVVTSVTSQSIIIRKEGG